MRYVLSIILILAMVVSMSSCLLFFEIKDTTQWAKDEFSQYFNGKNEVVLEFSNEIHFEDHILKHTDLEFSGTHINCVFYDNLIYYASEDSKNGCINFYSCDLYGKNVQKIYSHFWNEGNDVIAISGREYSFFIKSVNDDFVFIDKYTVPTNVYEKIDKGKKGEKFDLSNYQEENNSKYSIEMIKKISDENNGKFVITDLESGLKKTIDDEFLKSMPYFESMQKFSYGPHQYVISKGHIFLNYTIGAGDGFNYSHLILEYDFESDKLDYRMLAFTHDYSVDIFYTGK